MTLLSLDLQEVDYNLKVHGYMIVKDQILEQLCTAARAEYIECFKNINPKAPSEIFDYKTLRLGPWRKNGYWLKEWTE